MNLTEIYANRRKRLTSQLPGGIFLINSGGVTTDALLRDRNLEYLTGVTAKSTYLMLAPEGIAVEHFETMAGPELMGGRIVHEILFVEEQSAIEKYVDGEKPALEVLRERAGVDRVMSLKELNATLSRALMDNDVLWLNTPGTPQLNKPLTQEQMFINQLRERFYWVEFKNVAKCIHQMRFVKDAYEIENLRQAFQIHSEIFEKIMRTLKPGDNESLGHAIFDYEVLVRGVTAGVDSDYEASIIVGAGKNTTVPHYMANNQVIGDDDLVLIDAGVAVNGYSSDITRTFPANGKFTPRQRELYAVVLEALHAGIDTMKPGATMIDSQRAVYNTLKKYDLNQYGYGYCGHPVGLSIHDPHGRYAMDREQPFEPGVVVVLEPFIAIPNEGIGIRIEDGILITENGHEILAGPPREIDEVEALCQR